MKFPNFEEEKKLWEKGFNFVAGLDEAGRGPLAGPVVAAAVVLKLKNWKLIENCKLKIKNLSEVRDSKQLTPKKREQLYEIITMHPNIKWGIGIVSEKVIDKINILEATKLAMQKAVAGLQKSLKNPAVQKFHDRSKFTRLDYLLLDGNFKIKSDIRQRSIIRGDEKVMSIVMASIIAKVTRDRIMRKFHKKYPQYGFDKHKGYGTKAHFASLKKFGPCKIHRKSFYPISES